MTPKDLFRLLNAIDRAVKGAPRADVRRLLSAREEALEAFFEDTPQAEGLMPKGLLPSSLLRIPITHTFH